MEGSRISTTVLILALLAFITIPAVSGSPSRVSGEIIIPTDNPILLSGDNTTMVEISGFFSVTEKSGPDILNPTHATLSVSKGQWDPVLSKTQWEDVQKNENYDFTLTLTIPHDAGAGDSASYTLYLKFYNSINQEVGGGTGGTVVRIQSAVAGPGDDAKNDTGPLISAGDESIPLWPLFIAIVVAGIIIAGIWAGKNLEIVREVDGSRRVYLREKDSGRLIGRKRRPPGSI